MLIPFTKVVRFISAPISGGYSARAKTETITKTPQQLEEGSDPQQEIINTPQRSLIAAPTLRCLKQLVEHAKPLHAIILGRRATGKSSITKDLILCHFQRSPDARALIFHGTERLFPVYGSVEDICERSTIYNEYDGEVLEAFLSARKKLSDDISLVVFDNCFDMGTSRCLKIQALMKSKVNTIISADHPLSIPASVRLHSNRLFLFKEHVYIYRKRIFDNWDLSRIFHNMNVFENMHRVASEPEYGYLIVDLDDCTCYIGRSLTPIEDKSHHASALIEHHNQRK